MSASVSPNSFAVDKLSIRETQLLQLALDDVLPCLTADVRYQFKTTCTVLFSPDQLDFLRVDMQVKATARPPAAVKSSSKATAKLTVAVVFHYAELSVLRQQQAVPLGLGWTAVSIAYSTVRGLLQARLAGTSFGGAILPIVSPQTLWQPPTPVAEAAEADET